MLEDIQRILLDRQTIQARVHEMARQIAADYAAAGHREFLLMPLLTGSIIFVADLVRHMPVRMRIDVLAVSSYRATSHQGTRVLYPTAFDVRDKQVLVIDDILDSGRTLKTVTDLLRQQGAGGIKTCVLLKKNLPTPPAMTTDYVGFDIPDEFVVGYGLDFDGYYRNLPDIAILRPRVFQQPPSIMKS
jgi:hypoxanthine phosphoribosyltransferase